jgi:hypothetical protein
VAAECDFGYNALLTILSYLRHNTQITKLVLDKNPIGDHGVLKLVEVLPKLNKLEELSLVSINMTSKSGRALLQSIKGHPKLTVFNI